MRERKRIYKAFRTRERKQSIREQDDLWYAFTCILCEHEFERATRTSGSSRFCDSCMDNTTEKERARVYHKWYSAQDRNEVLREKERRDKQRLADIARERELLEKVNLYKARCSVRARASVLQRMHIDYDENPLTPSTDSKYCLVPPCRARADIDGWCAQHYRSRHRYVSMLK